MADSGASGPMVGRFRRASYESRKEDAGQRELEKRERGVRRRTNLESIDGDGLLVDLHLGGEELSSELRDTRKRERVRA